jgi:hypothetical protein
VNIYRYKHPHYLEEVENLAGRLPRNPNAPRMKVRYTERQLGQINRTAGRVLRGTSCEDCPSGGAG